MGINSLDFTRDKSRSLNNSADHTALVSSADIIPRILMKIISFDNEFLTEGTGQLSLSLDEVPYFADHAFQDMVILPGSAFIELAMLIFKKLNNITPSRIRNIKFGNLVILTDEVKKLKFKISDSGSMTSSVIFYEETASDKFATIIEIDNSDEALIPGTLELADFMNSKGDTISAVEFYNKLSVNGNQYGPSFRNIKQLWFKGNTAVCRLDFSEITNVSDNEFLLNPVKLDSFTQLLSALTREDGKTFILSSVSEIEIFNRELPDLLYCSASLTEGSAGSGNYEGNLIVFDDEGTIHLKLSGVQFKFFDNSSVIDSVEQKPAGKVCISSTFTAEPLEDSLRFWNKYFETGYEIYFTPYNQVFQELLDPGSMLASNRKGYNIILLGLEDWTRHDQKLVPLVNQYELDTLFSNKSRYRLPNQLEIVHLNKYETEYIYREIFVDKAYLKNGITLNDGDTVIDIGANIGLFTLFVNQHCKDPKVYAYEPSPVIYELLRLNSLVYGSDVKTFNLGVSDREKTAEFTFYRNSSVFSGFNPDLSEDSDAVRTVIKNAVVNAAGNGIAVDDYVDDLTAARLDSELYECRLLSVSDIIRVNHLNKIDLLKIDAEKSELEIIRGIRDDDWNKIRQIVIEIHDKTGNILQEIENILASRGFSCVTEEEKSLHGSGLFNLFAVRKNSFSGSADNNYFLTEGLLKEDTENFINAVSTFMQRSDIPLIVAAAPGSKAVTSNRKLNDLYKNYEAELLASLNLLPNVYTIASSTLLKNYPAEDFYDELGDQLGHVPYSLPFFASAGTTLFRVIMSIQNPPRKVIALDCDNTLWKGVCGEDGPAGIQVSGPFRFLQKFLLDKIESGMLVCLCSKNNEEDVMAVFNETTGMLLKKSDLVAWRTNWESKSSNLISLAEELNLGLDSFIFIDDNPVECAEVKSSLPQVLTLQLPQDEQRIPQFLENVWAFDIVRITEEDKKRSLMYRENLQREKFRSGSMTLRDFIDGLNLKVNISNPLPAQIPRVSQLTYRTNQFNFTTRRRSEAEINQFLAEKNNGCLIAEVSDRFGDYGLVGLLLYSRAERYFVIDTFLLSCRVLGRGVEYLFLSEFGRRSFNEGIEFIDIRYTQTPKNKPALEFFKRIGSRYNIVSSEGELMLRIPVADLSELKRDDFPGQNVPSGNNSESGVKQRTEIYIHKTQLSEKIQKTADELNNAFVVYNAIEEQKRVPQNGKHAKFLPSNDLERNVMTIWAKILNKNNLDIRDNFFEAGGTSLKAVQLVSAIKRELNLNLSVVDIFECPTIELLSKKYSDLNNLSSGENSGGAERAERRRNQNISRKRQ